MIWKQRRCVTPPQAERFIRIISKISHPLGSKRKLFAVLGLTAYLDESHSGKPNTHYYVVAGLLATANTWAKFSRFWQLALKPHGIEVFHSSDCQNHEGEFDGWTREQEAALSKDLADVLCRYNLTMVGACLDVWAYEEHFKIIRKKMAPLDTPYNQCLAKTMNRIVNETADLPRAETVALVLDINQEKKHGALLKFDERKRKYPEYARFSSIDFKSKEEFIPLQAADAFAYEGYKNVHFVAKNPRATIRRFTNDLLLRGMNGDIDFMDEEILKLHREATIGRAS
jgi:hypothetical protein